MRIVIENSDINTQEIVIQAADNEAIKIQPGQTGAVDFEPGQQVVVTAA